MLYLLEIFLVAHGLLHLAGFSKAFDIGINVQLKSSISKVAGIFWLMAAALLVVTAGFKLLEKDFWWIPASAAIVLSQVLVFTAWHDAKYGTIVNMVLIAIAIPTAATQNFESKFKNDVEGQLKIDNGKSDSLLTEMDIAHLPEPVKKYIRLSGALNHPKVKNFRVEFIGQIRKDEPSGWMPFSSVQYNFLDSSTRLFFMKATMKHLPVAGYHAYKNANASMDIRLLSLMKVQYSSGKEMNIAETVTFFNDMCCMAPATLIDKRIHWEEEKENKVKVSLMVNSIKITAWLYFDSEGRLSNFISDDRYATLPDGTMKPFRWSTPIRGYKKINGFELPSEADAIYSYPNGDFCYGNFKTVEVAYNVTQLK